MRRIAGLTRSGGTIVLEVPNVECVWAPLFRQAWDNWYVPYHRVHFRRTSLRAVVERAGLTVEREIGACIPSMGRTLANMIGSDNSLPLLLAGMALHPLQWTGERMSGRPSALRLIARKP